MRPQFWNMLQHQRWLCFTHLISWAFNHFPLMIQWPRKKTYCECMRQTTNSATTFVFKVYHWIIFICWILKTKSFIFFSFFLLVFSSFRAILKHKMHCDESKWNVSVNSKQPSYTTNDKQLAVNIRGFKIYHLRKTNMIQRYAQDKDVRAESAICLVLYTTNTTSIAVSLNFV